MADIIQVRRDTTTNWESVNPVLHQGELGWDLDQKKLKIGDGVTAWSSLAFFGDVPVVTQSELDALVAAEDLSVGSLYYISTNSSLVIATTASSYSIIAGAATASKQFERLSIFNQASALRDPMSSWEDIQPHSISSISPIHSSYESSIIVVNDTFVLASLYSTQYVATSADCMTWTLRATGVTAYYANAMASNGSTAMILGRGARTCAVSADGITWTQKDIPGNVGDVATRNTLTVLGNRWLCISAQTTLGTYGYYSDNAGTSWTSVTFPATFYRVGVLDGKFIGIPSDSVMYYTSTLGTTGSWTAVSCPYGVAVKGIFPDYYMFCDYGYSNDGINWQYVPFSTTPTNFLKVNSVWANFSTTVGAARTMHNGNAMSRACGFAIVNNLAAMAENTSIIGLTYNGRVFAYGKTNGSNPTALFDVVE